MAARKRARDNDTLDPGVNDDCLMTTVRAEAADIMGEFKNPTPQDYQRMALAVERAQGPRQGPDGRFWRLVTGELRRLGG